MNRDFFFCDSPSLMSCYSVGEVWLYFYQEILIGVRDIQKQSAALLRVTDELRKPDGYSHRHKITQADVNRAFEREAYVVNPDPGLLYLNEDELQLYAFKLVAQSAAYHVDRALNI